ncbi:hypothetical protein PS9374_02687 [Planomonospora sphaerica]|uniref:Uncharacterized protein n=1 Tax=Planomonospora sphaerica TaxID=161355 RepID=A0A161LHB4_9ACTN|nr:hypothetical protein [Planomonospora sphaerica]GAT67034.1 hypothetical protein PS9374_02687 [Planomonospora sphaerica]
MVTVTARLEITGTHGTGTTTLARRIEMELRATGLSVTTPTAGDRGRGRSY